MKKWKHLNFEQRKTIASGIAHNYKLKDIAELISFDSTSISKEVKRNRIPIHINSNKPNCPKLERWPFVCYNCKYRYTDCKYKKMKYDAKTAQSFADSNLINSRRGLDLDDGEFNTLDSLIKNGVDNNKSIYQIKIENNDIIDKSVTTLYRYINKGYLTTKRVDLPYAVKYKKEIIIKSMSIPTIIKLTELVILILIICHTSTSIQESTSGS